MSNPFLGEIRLFAGTFFPRGWAFCDGQLLAIDQNDALYALIGTTFGGDGQTTFGLPNLQGRVPVGQGTGPGLSSYVVGQMSGDETVSLTSNQIPSHSHAPQATTAAGNTSSPGPAVLPATPTGGTTPPSLYVIPGTSTVSRVAMQTGLLAQTGSGQPHDNMAPTLAVNYIIAIEGIFPSRN